MSRWTDPNSPAYWNKLLKEEGLQVVKPRQIIGPRRGESRGHYLRRMKTEAAHRAYLEREARRQAKAAGSSSSAEGGATSMMATGD